MPTLRRLLLCAAAALFFAAPLGAARAIEADPESEPPGASAPPSGTYSKLPLPRFVSLKSARVNLRVGPGKDYAVSWLYLKPGLPVEVVQEYELWRRVRDSEGSEGWVYHSLLSGERTAIAAPWLAGKSATVDLRRSASDDSGLVAKMEPGVVTKVKECGLGWCEVEVANRDGYVRQNEMWGVYPDERF
ncbi:MULTISPECIES: SH3 domain-containing protein [unclassified Aureimonas]|uniref:SH3 domain-containing protein n=1 Tax=unclassified Aureimonas TaxID=2615206 RepID=UPI0009E6E256|nr:MULTISPECIES: SH3 domain-containing protein [unclassified Aureimonas]